MTTTLRIDDALKDQCDLILDDMGLNLSCAITIFLKELIRRRAMPFTVRATGAQEYADLPSRYSAKCSDEIVKRGCRAKKLFAEMRASVDRNWSLDEINAEIAAARAEHGA